DAWGIAVKVGNRHKLKALLDVMVSEGMATPVKKRNGYSYVRFANSHTVCAFNEDVVLAIHSGNNNYIGIDSFLNGYKTSSSGYMSYFRYIEKTPAVGQRYFITLRQTQHTNAMPRLLLRKFQFLFHCRNIK
ncbi:MAG: hypothetical protein EZS26_003323, partial [Candidatus Ordinivivax streblomastigis]